MLTEWQTGEARIPDVKQPPSIRLAISTGHGILTAMVGVAGPSRAYHHENIDL
ncbi:hypothetical protein FHT28_005328 [Rhizobium sp. SG570]|nr:hypothetical protein [Rhizobium sp. SG570]NRP89751.1 hypothetical protein [Ensifer adhaerens]